MSYIDTINTDRVKTSDEALGRLSAIESTEKKMKKNVFKILLGGVFIGDSLNRTVRNGIEVIDALINKFPVEEHIKALLAISVVELVLGSLIASGATDKLFADRKSLLKQSVRYGSFIGEIQTTNKIFGDDNPEIKNWVSVLEEDMRGKGYKLNGEPIGPLRKRKSKG